jgi:hypothetical protein
MKPHCTSRPSTPPCVALFLLVALTIALTSALILYGLVATRHAYAAGTVIYVDQDSPGATHDGLTWTTAFTSLQGALSVAPVNAGVEIWVASGIYTPSMALTRTDTFQLKSGVAIYGGFAATETLLLQRDWTTNIVTLSGDLLHGRRRGEWCHP